MVMEMTLIASSPTYLSVCSEFTHVFTNTSLLKRLHKAILVPEERPGADFLSDKVPRLGARRRRPAARQCGTRKHGASANGWRASIGRVGKGRQVAVEVEWLVRPVTLISITLHCVSPPRAHLQFRTPHPVVRPFASVLVVHVYSNCRRRRRKCGRYSVNRTFLEQR